MHGVFENLDILCHIKESVAILELEYRGPRVLFDDQKRKKQVASISDTHKLCKVCSEIWSNKHTKQAI